MLKMPHASARQRGRSPKNTNPAGMKTSGAIDAMKSAWATLVRVSARNTTEMLTPKHERCRDRLSPRVAGRAATGRSGRRRITRKAHQSTADPMSRHQAIDDPGTPGHLMTDRLIANATAEADDGEQAERQRGPPGGVVLIGHVGRLSGRWGRHRREPSQRHRARGGPRTPR